MRCTVVAALALALSGSLASADCVSSIASLAGCTTGVGIGGSAPSASSTDTGRQLFVARHQPAPGTGGGVALFTNDPSMPPAGIVGIPEYATATAVIHNTQQSPLFNNISGYEVYGVNDGPAIGGHGNMVGMYSNVECRAQGSACWGFNPNLTNTPNASNANLIGTEIDINNNVPSALGSGMVITGASTSAGQPGVGYSAMSIQLLDQQLAPAIGVNPIQWQYGIYIAPGTSKVALNVGEDEVLTANRGSMPVAFNWTDSAGTGHSLALNATPQGVLALSAPIQASAAPPAGCNSGSVGSIWYDASTDTPAVCVRNGNAPIVRHFTVQ